MNYLSPSLLSADFGNLEKEIKLVTDNGAEYIHIDVMDGIFVHNISFGIPAVEGLRKCCDKVLDVHLMITKPERYIERFAASGADIITVHLESTDDPRGAIELIHSFGKKAGLSIKPGTDIAHASKYAEIVDMFLVMTVEPGFGGQKFMAEMLDKVRELRIVEKQKGLSFDIEADGGINLDNVRLLLDAGVNIIVAGSSIFTNGKTADNTREFMKIINDGRRL